MLGFGKRLVGSAFREVLAERDAAHKALNEIAAQETAGANATVKRMANMAREALPKNEIPAIAAE